uniref:Kinesin motor domain-containing protein n=1 Tax=Sinocyclocheilus grahami TaxID=75366 RepID=A0A672LAK6_SINGR
MSDTKVKVAVRVRPMNRREIELSTKCVVEMEENQTILHPPPSNAKGESRYSHIITVFAFDHCFWSMDESNIPKYAGESGFNTHTSAMIMDYIVIWKALEMTWIPSVGSENRSARFLMLVQTSSGLLRKSKVSDSMH